jgi:hypothetical protein
VLTATGSEQAVAVPTGVYLVIIAAYGGTGGSPPTPTITDCFTAGSGGSPGLEEQGTVSVTPGEQLTVVVGGNGGRGSAGVSLEPSAGSCDQADGGYAGTGSNCASAAVSGATSVYGIYGNHSVAGSVTLTYSAGIVVNTTASAVDVQNGYGKHDHRQRNDRQQRGDRPRDQGLRIQHSQPVLLAWAQPR